MTEVRSECHGNTMEMELWAVLCKSILMETLHNAVWRNHFRGSVQRNHNPAVVVLESAFIIAWLFERFQVLSRKNVAPKMTDLEALTKTSAVMRVNTDKNEIESTLALLI